MSLDMAALLHGWVCSAFLAHKPTHEERVRYMVSLGTNHNRLRNVRLLLCVREREREKK